MPNHKPIPASTSARGRSGSSQTTNDLTPDDTAAPASAPVLELHSEPTDAERLARLLIDFGSVDGYTARVERTRSGSTPAELCGYLGSMTFSDDFLDDVRHEHGGGRFRARIYDARGDYKTSFPFAIAGTPRRPGESTAAPVGVGPASAAGESRIERMIGELAAAVAGLAQLQQTPAAGRNEDELERFLKVARALKELNPPAAPATSGLADLEAFFRLQDMLDERRPAGDGNGLGAIVEHGVKPLAALASRSLDLQERAMTMKQGQARAIAAPARPAAPIGGPAPAPPISEHVDDVDPIYTLAAGVPPIARGYLANAARNDRDPETYAIMVLDTIQEHNPATYAQLPELVQRADFLDRLLDVVPAFAEHRAWFAQLVDFMRIQLQGAAAEDTSGGDVDGAAA